MRVRARAGRARDRHAKHVLSEVEGARRHEVGFILIASIVTAVPQLSIVSPNLGGAIKYCVPESVGVPNLVSPNLGGVPESWCPRIFQCVRRREPVVDGLGGRQYLSCQVLRGVR